MIGAPVVQQRSNDVIAERFRSLAAEVTARREERMPTLDDGPRGQLAQDEVVNAYRDVVACDSRRTLCARRRAKPDRDRRDRALGMTEYEVEVIRV
jgi:hypothetical protein